MFNTNVTVKYEYVLVLSIKLVVKRKHYVSCKLVNLLVNLLNEFNCN